MYTVDYFIEKFRNCPRDKWIVGTLCTMDGRRCAMGWCNFDEQRGLNTLFIRVLSVHPETVNDGNFPAFQQIHPKDRIIAALQYIKSLQEKERAETLINEILSKKEEKEEKQLVEV